MSDYNAHLFLNSLGDFVVVKEATNDGKRSGQLTGPAVL